VAKRHPSRGGKNNVCDNYKCEYEGKEKKKTMVLKNSVPCTHGMGGEGGGEEIPEP